MTQRQTLSGRRINDKNKIKTSKRWASICLFKSEAEKAIQETDFIYLSRAKVNRKQKEEKTV